MTPTVKQLQELQEEVARLKDKIAHTKGEIQQLKREVGDDLETVRQKLEQMKVLRQELIDEYQRSSEAFQSYFSTKRD